MLSFAMIIQCMFDILPIPVRTPPAGTSSPGYNSWPASGDSSRNDVPGSISAAIRLCIF